MSQEYYEEIPGADLQAEENRIVNKALTAFPDPYLTGLKLEGGISIDGLTLNTIEYPTVENGYAAPVVWVVSDLDGWWTLPESELPDLPRGWGDGSYDSIGRWSNRIVTLNGSFLTQDPTDAPLARARLLERVSLIKRSGWLVVDEDDRRRGSKMRLSGTPMISSIKARGRHDFSVGLKAVDPIKYQYVDNNNDAYLSETLNSTGVTVENYGNVPVPVVFQITGSPSSGAKIERTSPGDTKTIELVKDVPNDLEIDTYNREALLIDDISDLDSNVSNGRSNLATLVDWIYLEPGDNVLKYTGTGTCTVLYRSGWIG